MRNRSHGEILGASLENRGSACSDDALCSALSVQHLHWNLNRGKESQSFKRASSTLSNVPESHRPSSCQPLGITNPRIPSCQFTAFQCFRFRHPQSPAAPEGPDTQAMQPRSGTAPLLPILALDIAGANTRVAGPDSVVL